MHSDNHAMRKAAILIATLDPAAAELVLARLDPRQAEALRRMAAALGDVATEERQRTVEEFCRIGPLVPEKQPPGIELDGQLARKLALRAHRPAASDPAPPRPAGPPFQFLHEAEADKLARILGCERAQTIALVLAHLPPEQAGSVLARFHAPLQVEVVRRLVELEETEPEILWEVERALESRLSEQIRMQRRRVAGLSAVAGILRAAEPRVGSQILENLAAHDPQLAGRLGPERLDFAALEQFDDASLGTLFDAADRRLTVLALLGAPPALVQRVLNQFPQIEAGQFREQLAHVGPTRLSDVEEARRQIMELARSLAIRRRIRLPGRHGGPHRPVPEIAAVQ